jgi:short-subunit dehydrogenase
MSFEGKIALVTGASSGIGAALAAELARRGAKVFSADIDAKSMLRLDVTDAARFRVVADDIVAREGRIDLLFNNAGIGLAGEARDLESEDWRRVVEVNLIGVMNGIAAVYPGMVARGRGHIVNTASGAGLAPRPGMAAYAATKHGVVGLSTSLRAEAQRHGVEVSAICPGYVATSILESTKYVKLDRDGVREAIPIRAMSAAKCAELALAGVAKRRAIIPISPYVWADWLLFRLSPSLSLLTSAWRANKLAEHRTS